MKRIRFGLGGLLMISAMFISDYIGVFAVYFFAAAVHELGHLIAAKALGFVIKEIRFEFSGVRIYTNTALSSYKKELTLAAAGPAANLLIFCTVSTVWTLSSGPVGELFEESGRFMAGESGVGGALAFFALSSLVQAIVNLLPVESFDGGRILYCAAAALISERCAQRVVAIAGAFSAFVLWTFALYLMLSVSSGLGIYVFAACIFLCGDKSKQIPLM